MADSKLINLPALTTPSADDLLYIVDDPAGTPVSKKITYANLTAGLGGGGSGVVVQVKTLQTGATATGAVGIPVDDTLPQNTEGTEFLTLAITPTSATNRLKIDVTFFLSAALANKWLIGALFQDTGVNALAVAAAFNPTATAGFTITFSHTMLAGTTSATTFKLRAGSNDTTAVRLNGQAAIRLWGGAAASSMTITELTP